MQSVPVDKNAKKQADVRLTRAQKIENNGGTPLMPDVGEADYLVAYWQDTGMVGNGAMGIVALSAADLNHWQQGTSIKLNPWEFSIIRDMSRAYVNQYHDSEKPDCPPPYGEPELDFDRTLLSKKISNAMNAFMMGTK